MSAVKKAKVPVWVVTFQNPAAMRGASAIKIAAPSIRGAIEEAEAWWKSQRSIPAGGLVILSAVRL